MTVSHLLIAEALKYTQSMKDSNMKKLHLFTHKQMI